MSPASAVRALEVGSRLGVVRSASGSAEVWSAWVGDHQHDMERFSREMLSDAERDHLRGYRIRASAERYVLTRSLVRAVLAERLVMAPRDIPVSRTDTGKPVVAGGVHFNVSHSGDLIVLAVSTDRDIGVDIERKRDVARVEALASRWLSVAERSELAAIVAGGATVSEAFLRVWSVKEARIKALGVGISGASRVRLDVVEALPLDAILHLLASRRGGADYVGAIAFA